MHSSHRGVQKMLLESLGLTAVALAEVGLCELDVDAGWPQLGRAVVLERRRRPQHVGHEVGALHLGAGAHAQQRGDDARKEACRVSELVAFVAVDRIQVPRGCCCGGVVSFAALCSTHMLSRICLSRYRVVKLVAALVLPDER